MVERIVLIWPFDPRRLGTNRTRGMHPMALSRLAKQSALLMEYAFRVAGEPKMPPPVRLTLIVRRGHRVDDDTVTTGFKWARDRLTKLLGYRSDGPKWLSQGEVRYECGKRWLEQPHVEVWIEPRGD